ncbi:Exocyst complex component Sec5-like protein [Sarcoptes scabiei]|uniref:Vacuolar protein sorting-associated protein 51 homolog n=1 Tax=Sarcoptes scabiei TaxID=52283 RepID=A0A132AE42_SARSC|nr:Exocyst complex component Sec5-like protein [Sarcoptes scabiei]
MDSITSKSEMIAENLNQNRDELARMSSKNQLLDKIQFILKLPKNMQTLIKENRFNEAVDNFLNAEISLKKYNHLASFKNIQIECDEMLEEIKIYFYNRLSDEDTSIDDLNKSVGYLLKLQENPTKLCEKYFQLRQKKMTASLQEIRFQSESENIRKPDILEFLNDVCENYLNSLNECIKFFLDCFLREQHLDMIDQETLKQMKSQLKRFVSKQIDALFEIASDFIKKEQKNDLNILMFGRALDRFYKRIQFLNNYEDLADLSRKSLDLIQESTKNQCDYYRNKLISKYNEELANVLHDLINDSSRTINRSTSNQSQNFSKFSKPMSAYQDGGKKQLLEAVINFETSICENLKQIFADLNPFLYQELTFSNKEFRKFFQNCLYDIIIKYVESILESFEEYEHHHSTTHLPSCFMLILSKVCLDLSESIISYMFGFAEETLSKSVSKNSNKLAAPFNSRARLNAQKLLDAYVWLEGQSISQMIRKSVETRDWLSTVEPRSVRSVMKRVIEDITSIDYMIGQLYEEGTRIERSSDSSRNWSAFGFNRSNFPKSNWSIGSRLQVDSRLNQHSFDNSIISNIQKIFNDKIEIFGSVEFSKLSVATGIIKISLKTLIECVRLCTFSRYGFQQIQVDSYYLQTKLWRFISDEKIILNLIDEVISSSKKRCLDPIGMERSVIENIYDNV